MKILFIVPGIYDKNCLHQITKRIFHHTKSLTFPILAALTPNKYSIELIETGPIDYNQDYDLVGITAMTYEVLRAYEIADKFRERGFPVVLGGWHASALPDEAKQHADSVVIGEAEDTWPQLLNDFEKKKLKGFYIQKKPVNSSSIPLPKTSIYPKKFSFGIMATRGCPHGCKFCAITNQKFRNIYRKRPVENVIEDVRRLISGKIFIFDDNSLTIDINYTKKLFKELRKLNKNFTAFGNINVLGQDDEFLRLAKDAGCISWLIGFESIIQSNLESIAKKTNIVDKYVNYIKKIHDYDMTVVGEFIFGFDHDDVNIFDKTYEFIERSEIDIPYYNILTPLPGTPLYTTLDAEKRIITKNWSKYDFENVVFKPKNMTPEELYDNTKYLYKKSYRPSHSIQRIIRSTRFGFYQTMPVISRNIEMISRKYFNNHIKIN